MFLSPSHAVRVSPNTAAKTINFAKDNWGLTYTNKTPREAQVLSAGRAMKKLHVTTRS